MRKSLLISAIFFALLAGCGPEEKPGQLIAVNESIERSNKIIIKCFSLQSLSGTIAQKKAPGTTV